MLGPFHKLANHPLNRCPHRTKKRKTFFYGVGYGMSYEKAIRKSKLPRRLARELYHYMQEWRYGQTLPKAKRYRP